jgi:2-polyprenyl-3-methyl-5-hydroxy-6-metoxy-1,4-benzoquinol methylase
MALVMGACPVCQASAFEPLYAATVESESDDPASYFSSSRSRAGYLPIVRCRTCGLVQENPRDDAATLARVYASLEDAVYDQEDDNRRVAAERHLGFVTRHVPKPGKLLDVGCSTGLFAVAAARAGWESTGIDASTWSIERAKERRSAARFEAASLETLALPERSFDVITLWDVLEHVSDPAAVVRQAERWLKPGGWFFLSLPNAASWTARALGRRWVLLLREHLWYFSPETIGRLLRREGFEVVATKTKWVSFSLANVAGRLGQYDGPHAATMQRLAKLAALRKTSVGFPMGEMNVAARRSP